MDGCEEHRRLMTIMNDQGQLLVITKDCGGMRRIDDLLDGVVMRWSSDGHARVSKMKNNSIRLSIVFFYYFAKCHTITIKY